MKKITLIIPLCISLIVFWSCSHKYNYSKYYSYMANRYVKVYELTINPQFILNFMILHQDSNEQDSCGVYEYNTGPTGDKMIIGEWNIKNDTLTLHPHGIYKYSKSKITNFKLAKDSDNYLDTMVYRYLIRNDELIDVTDYSGFHRFMNEEFVFDRREYTYDSTDTWPAFKLVPFK